MITLVLLLTGFGIGTFCLPAGELLFHLLIRAPELQDGQYPILLMMLTLPGAVLGGLTGLGYGLHRAGQRRRCQVVWLLGGAAMAWLSIQWGYYPTQWGSPLRNLLVLMGPALLWSLALVIASLRCTSAKRADLP